MSEPSIVPTRRQALGLFGAVAVTGLASTGASAAPSSSAAPHQQAGPVPTTSGGRRVVYVGCYADGSAQAPALHAYHLDATGLDPVQAVTGVQNPSWLALHPSLPILYATSEVGRWNGQPGGGAVAFAVDTATGTLGRLGDQPVGGSPAHAVVAPGGAHLVVANYGGATVGVVGLRSDGDLLPLTDLVTVTGNGPDPQRQSGPHPHQAVFDPAGEYCLVPDLGTDKVWVWRLDSEGTLVPADVPHLQVASGSGPRHLAFHPDGRTVYVLGELTSSITVLSYDPARGTGRWRQTVSTLPAAYVGESSAGEIAVHPSGRFLYASNRGHDSIAGFRIDPDDGTLRALGWEPTRGQLPRSFALAPEGDLMLVANQDSGSIVSFGIHPRTGKLNVGGVVAEVQAPACVTIGARVINRASLPLEG